MASTKVAELVRQNGGLMSYIDYIGGGDSKGLRDDNKEFLRSDLWEFRFTMPPKIVYYPGDDLFKRRLTSVQVGIDDSVIPISKRVRGGFTINQSVSQNMSGTLSLAFVDREDQAIIYMFHDWKNKIADPETMYSFRKADLVADCQMILTNSSRVPVRTLDFFNCQLTAVSNDESGATEAGGDRADVQVQMSFESYRRTYNNI